MRNIRYNERQMRCLRVFLNIENVLVVQNDNEMLNPIVAVVRAGKWPMACCGSATCVTMPPWTRPPQTWRTLQWALVGNSESRVSIGSRVCAFRSCFFLPMVYSVGAAFTPKKHGSNGTRALDYLSTMHGMVSLVLHIQHRAEFRMAGIAFGLLKYVVGHHYGTKIPHATFLVIGLNITIIAMRDTNVYINA